jgi:hypothetical protein
MDEIPVEPRALADTMTSSLRSPRPSSWRPAATVPAGLWDAKRELMVVNETLRWLHEHWDMSDARNANPQGNDAKARARMMAWRAVRPCLEPYFQEEQDVIANLVRIVDALAKRVDALASDHARLLGAVRADLVDAAGHFEDAIAGIGVGLDGTASGGAAGAAGSDGPEVAGGEADEPLMTGSDVGAAGAAGSDGPEVAGKGRRVPRKVGGRAGATSRAAGDPDRA